ncbi:MAG: spermidine synthase [Alphaproteobacteria bacterium]
MNPREIDPVRKHPAERAALYAATFLLGAIVMAFEMLATRYLNPFFGSSIYTWGSLIAVVLAGMACGYFLGGRVADRFPSPAVFAGIIAPAPLLLLMLPQIADHVALGFAETDLDVRLGVLAAALILFFLPTMLLSAAGPFAIRLLIASRERAGHIAGAVYAISTAGSIVGTLGTVFFLIPNFGTRANTYGLAVLSALIVPIILTPRWLRRTGMVAGVFLCAFAVLSPQAATARQPTLQDLTEGLIDQEETPYNQIYVFRDGDYRTMKFGLYERRFTESVSNAKKPRELPLAYTRAMTMAAACSANANRALMIGLGGGTVVRYLEQFMPETQFVQVEIDPGVIRLAKKHFGVRESPRMRIVERDGRHFLNREKEPYAIIFVDAYRGWFVPFHLTTREFYALAKSKLAPGGCLVQNVDPSTLLFDATMATISKVFTNVDTMKAGGNIVIFAYEGSKRHPRDWAGLAKTAQQRYRFAYDLRKLAKDFQPVKWNRSTSALTDDFAPSEILNMEDRPPR